MTLNEFGFATLPAQIVGATLVWTAGIKAFAPHAFRRHIATLGWIPFNWQSHAVTAAAGVEAAWGAALLTNAAPAFVLPVSIVLFVALSTFTLWTVKSGKADDCGCYGGYIQPSIGQSLGINGALVALLLLSLIFQGFVRSIDAWQVIGIASLGILAAAIAIWAQRFEATHGRPRFTPSPLVVGAKWRKAWAGGETISPAGETIIALLGPDCPFCKQWVKIGNAMIQSPELPDVIGVVGAPKKRRDEFTKEHGIRFPVAAISPSLMSRLAQAVPTTVLVNDGRIAEMWVGRMPPEFAERFRKAFFPDHLVNALQAEALTSQAPSPATRPA